MEQLRSNHSFRRVYRTFLLPSRAIKRLGRGAPGQTGRVPVLVVSHNDWYGTLTLPRLLVRAGCAVTLVCRPGSRLSRSRFADRVLRAQTPESIVAQTSSEWSSGAYRRLIVADEKLLPALAADATMRNGLPVDPQTVGGAAALSTFAFLEAGSKAGLPIPEYRICANAEEVREFARVHGYPIVLRQGGLGAGEGIRMVHEPESVAVAAAELGLPLCAQRFVHGRNGSTDVLYERGRSVFTLSTLNHDPYPTPVSPKTRRSPLRDAGVERAVTDVGAFTGFSGLAGIDWILDASGTAWLLEINPQYESGFGLDPSVEAAAAAAIGALYRDEPAVSLPFAERELIAFPEHAYYLIDRAYRGDRAAWLRLPPALKRAPFDEPAIACALVTEWLRHALAAPPAFAPLRRRLKTLLKRRDRTAGSRPL